MSVDAKTKKTARIGSHVRFGQMLGQVTDIQPDGKIEVEFRVLKTFDPDEVDVYRQ